MNISPEGIAFIERNEGYVAHAHAYADAGGQSIGFGHKILPGEDFPHGVTREQAEAILREDVTKVETVLAHLVPPDCTQGQWDALCDFGYNLGTAALRTMLAHGWDQVTTQMLRWSNIGQELSLGLLARRKAEVAMFLDNSVESRASGGA